MFASLVVAMGIALGACAERTPTGLGKTQTIPSAVPTSTPSASVPTPVPALTRAPQATKPPASSEILPFTIDAIREYLASQLTLPAEQVTLSNWQPVEWRDACLGVHKPKEMCLDVITPGFTLKFQTGATTTMVNTDATAKNFRLAQEPESPGPLPALSWIRTGGFAGVCQNLSVYSTGSYWLRDCKTDVVLAQGVLPEEQQTYLSELFKRYGSFEWKPMPSANSADMFIDQIRFYGTGSQMMPAEEQQKLNEYLAKLAGGLAGANPGASGIAGQVFIGPTCGGPVKAGSTECADKPYQATIMVLDSTGQLVTQFTTDAEGRFNVPLQPGAYTLHPESNGKLPAAADQNITVLSGQLLMVTITYDSGMR